MSSLLSLLLGTLILLPGPGPQARSETPTNAAFHAVSYFEVVSGSSRSAAIAALKEYQTAIRKQDGFVRYELFEQGDRPGHFVAIETWRDQAAFDARAATAQKQLKSSLEPIRTSDVDQRPYKTLTASPASGATNAQTVFVISHIDVSQSPQVPMLVQRLAEDSRKDQGNVRFDVLQHTMRANHFTVIEAWRNRKVLDAHAAAAHTKQYREELAPFLGSPLDERVFQSVALLP